MITDLKLNALHHLKQRQALLGFINFAIGQFDENAEGDWVFLEKLIDRASPHDGWGDGYHGIFGSQSRSWSTPS